MTENKEKTHSGFSELGVNPSILSVLKNLNLETPTPIQRKSIPVAIAGQDLIGVAQTGTGKTFAFGIPLIQRLAQVKGRALILLPTRELALQVEENIRKLGNSLGLKTVALIGGESINMQIMALRRKPHVIVATPGRLSDCMGRRLVKLDDIKILILDEADLMFDMGFAPQIEKILKFVPKERQTMLFSATMPPAILKLVAMHMHLPVSIEVAPSGTTVEKVDQEVFIMHQEDKRSHLEKVLNKYTGSVLVFTRTKHGARQLAREAKAAGHKAAEIHSNLSLRQRREALDGFKSGKHRILFATDIAARGLDVNNIELVINYDLPENCEDYVHRIGRTARAGNKGKAITFATPGQWRDVGKIERLIKKSLTLTKFAEPIQFQSHNPYTRRPNKSRFSSNRSQGGYRGRNRNFRPSKRQR
jgi:ATP-dependent RNA helicase RhlE